MAQKTVNNLIQNLLYQPRLSIHEEKELFQKLRKGDVAAENKLISSHLRFVHHIAKRYKNQGQPIADLIQEGAVGLMEALKRFNPDRGVRLSTYAIPGPADSGEICANGACCHKINVADEVIICTYCELSVEEIDNHSPTILCLNSKNEIVEKNNQKIKLA